MSEVALQPQRGPQRVRNLRIGDLQTALANTNPKASKADLHSIAVLTSAAVEVLISLTRTELRELVREPKYLRTALKEATRLGLAGERAHIEPKGRTLKSRGAGLGERLSLAEGRARLEDYATPGPIERWAGPVAGAGEIEQRLGVGRSTLNTWVKRGAVIGLLRGERKLAYPLEQFVDNRPLEGLAEVVRLAPDPRGAWLWLRQSNAALKGKTPLEVLRSGGKPAVLEAAAADLPIERDVA